MSKLQGSGVPDPHGTHNFIEPEAGTQGALRGRSGVDWKTGGAQKMKLSNIVRYLVIAAVAATVIVSLPDIKRYIKISTM